MDTEYTRVIVRMVVGCGTVHPVVPVNIHLALIRLIHLLIVIKPVEDPGVQSGVHSLARSTSRE